MSAQNRAEYMRTYRSYVGGKPVRKFGGDLRFGRFVQRARHSPRGRNKITLDELAFETGISPKTIGRIARSQETVSVQHAWIIGQTFHKLGVTWSSGLLALAAASFDVELLGVLGWLMTLSMGDQEPAPYLQEHWPMLTEAPFAFWLELLLNPGEFPIADEDCFERGFPLIRALSPLVRALSPYDNDDELTVIRAALDVRSRHVERSNAAKGHPSLDIVELTPSFEAELRAVEESMLRFLRINDELFVALDLAWKRWSKRNKRDELPVEIQRAINALDQRVGCPGYKEVEQAWIRVQSDFFRMVSFFGFARSAPMFRPSVLVLNNDIDDHFAFECDLVQVG